MSAFVMPASRIAAIAASQASEAGERPPASRWNAVEPMPGSRSGP
jgi:hypothetical protein